MPQVPYQPYPTAQPENRAIPNVSINTPAAAFGANIGQAIETLGHTTEHVGDELFTRAIALQQLKNETEAKEADAQYMIGAGKLHADYSSLQGKAAVDAYPKYAQDLQELRKSIRGGLATDQSQKMYDSQSLSTMGRSIFNGAGHAATEQKQWAIGTAKAQIDLDSKTVEDSPGDDVLFQSKLNRVKENASQLAGLQGFDPEGPQAKDLTLKVTSQLWSQRIIGLSRTAPFEAARVLDDNKTNLTQGDYLKVDNAVRATSRAVGATNIANDVFAGGQETADRPAKSLKEMEAEAEVKAKDQNPDDPILAQHAVQTLRGKYNQEKYAAKQEDFENQQIIAGGIQAGVKDIQQLRANPKLAAAMDALPKDKQLAIPGQINRYNAAVDKTTNQDNFMRLKGMSNNDVESFLNTDLTHEKLSQQDMRGLMEQQRKLKELPNSDPRVSRAVGQIRGALGSQLEALKVYRRTDGNKDDYDHFTGAVQSALDVWQETNGKPPTYKDVVETIGPQVVRQIAEPGWLWGENKVPFFNQAVPKEFTEKLKSDVVGKGGAEPSPEQIQKAFIRTQFIKLYGKKEKSGE